MAVAIVTGAGGLVGSETARFFDAQGLDGVGIDNDMRAQFFGAEASTAWNRRDLETSLRAYTHLDVDIRDSSAIDAQFRKYGKDIVCVVHAAAQPSHDWAAKDPHTDFSVNATGTLNLLESARAHCGEAAFIFVSTNKVYGDKPNDLPLHEQPTRLELDETHPFHEAGIDESFSIDHSMHSVFGASKLAADIMVQEYGRYFGMNTVCFRGGCLTGPAHSGAELHGFLAYLVACAVTGRKYTVFGHGGKQVRDNIHSHDLVRAFWQYVAAPRPGEVYNIGGSRFANCSVIEAIALAERITGRPMNWSHDKTARKGDHMWWISDVTKFKRHYPDWDLTVPLETTMQEIADAQEARQEV